MSDLLPSEIYNQEIELASESARRQINSPDSHTFYNLLFPEWKIGNASAGYFDPYMGGCQYNICDLFPLFEKIILPIPHPPSEEMFTDMVGVSSEQLIELVKLNKILPLLSDPGGVPNYLRKLYEHDYPYVHRLNFYNLFVTNQQILTINEISYAGEELNSFFNDFVGVLFKDHNLSRAAKSLISKYLSNLCISHGLPVSLALLEFYASFTDKNLDILSQVKVNVTGLLHASSAKGFVQAYDSVDMLFLKKLKDISSQNQIIELSEKIYNDTGNNPLIINFNISEESKQLVNCSLDLMAQLKKEYFYEPPEYYSDPVKYAYYLMKQDDIKDNYKIISTIDQELKDGKYRKALLGSDDKIGTIFKEINSKVKRYERQYSFAKVVVNFGSLFMGVATGVFAGQALASKELSLLFTYCGAHAASILTQSYSEKISKILASPIFRKRNSAFLVWKKQRRS